MAVMMFTIDEVSLQSRADGDDPFTSLGRTPQKLWQPAFEVEAIDDDQIRL